MDVTIAGEGGTFQLGRMDEVNSRFSDYTLNTWSDNHKASIAGVIVRGYNSGHDTHTHKALEQITKRPADHHDAEALFRVRRPTYFFSNDFDEDGAFSYLELSSTAEGFVVQVAYVGSIESTSGPIVVRDPEAVAKLAVLYNAVQKDHIASLEHLKRSDSRSYIAHTLSLENWQRQEQYCQRWVDSADAHLHRELAFRQIKATGLFALKYGLGLPDETRDLWMGMFGDLPEVKATASRQR